MTTHAAAAKAIRNELKAIFPTIKFSVTSESFSMGNAVRISWTDGATTEQVDKIVSKYQYGYFDGMNDLYECDNRRDDIPQAKYITTSRSFSEEAKRAMAEKMGIEWNKYDELNIELGDYNAVLIRRELCKIDFTNTPETAGEEVEQPKEEMSAAPKERRFETVTFPSLNKNNTLAKNFEAMVMHGTYDERCEVMKTVELDSETFEEVANSLLESRPEMWEQIGGHNSDAPELENVTYEQMCSSKELTDIFRKTCYAMVVEVVETDGWASGRKFYVNTDGYGYARYVGVVTRKNEKN